MASTTTSSKRCAGKTKSGEDCQKMTKMGDYCHVHLDQDKTAKAEVSSKEDQLKPVRTKETKATSKKAKDFAQAVAMELPESDSEGSEESEDSQVTGDTSGSGVSRSSMSLRDAMKGVSIIAAEEEKANAADKARKERVRKEREERKAMQKKGKGLLAAVKDVEKNGLLMEVLKDHMEAVQNDPEVRDGVDALPAVLVRGPALLNYKRTCEIDMIVTRPIEEVDEAIERTILRLRVDTKQQVEDLRAALAQVVV